MDSMRHLYGQELGPGESVAEPVSWEGGERGARHLGVKFCFLRALTLGNNRIFNFLCLCSKYYTYIILPSKQLYEEDIHFRPVLEMRKLRHCEAQ